MKYAWDKMTETQKVKAVQHELDLETHNGTTKDDLLNILRWLWNQFEVVDIDDCKESALEGQELD